MTPVAPAWPQTHALEHTMQRIDSAMALLALLASATALLGVSAAPIDEPAFQQVWARTDRPVADGLVSRTWMWGSEALSGPRLEPYAESPRQQRLVQYFDKSRMEITAPDGIDDGIWYVTNGLLVVELVTGKVQVGDSQLIPSSPAHVNVAGDPTDTLGPTYASFTGLLDDHGDGPSEVLGVVINRDGSLASDEYFQRYGVRASQYDATAEQWIADPFWAFMTARGIIYRDGAYTEDTIFPNSYYATGLPITDAYWSRVTVAGNPKDVLIQCFERHCLTYTPSNEPAWQVEMGNVGQHYYAWRYADQPGTPTATVTPTATASTTPPISDTGKVEITGVLADPAGPDETGEAVYLRNADMRAIDLEDWMLMDGDGAFYTFPAFVLAPGASVTVHICTGTNDADDLYWGRCQATWDDEGEMAMLHDRSGTMVAHYTY